MRSASVNATGQAMQLTVLIPEGTDPFSPQGGVWIEDMRAAIKVGI